MGQVVVSIRIANWARWSQDIIPFWIINLCKYPKVRKNDFSNMIIKLNLYKMTKYVDWTCTFSGHLISTKNPVMLFFAWTRITNMHQVASIIKSNILHNGNIWFPICKKTKISPSLSTGSGFNSAHSQNTSKRVSTEKQKSKWFRTYND